MVSINNVDYEVIEDKRNAFSEEKLRERYSDVLSRYDYIVGDISHEQLRLRGFFEDSNPKASFDTKISTLNEYLLEYCNFGCAYFVIKKVSK
ncbi:MAG: hypothetical protein K0S34_1727 [Bacillales bacterium]|jgi:uncharacterized protein YutD|nr:hypothetical protein [Bacillales bacterium]